MKLRNVIILAIVTASIFMISARGFAAPGANLVYRESDLGSGLWQYDYSFYNTSTNGEFLYSVDLLFNQSATVNGVPLPAGWDSTTWEGGNQTDFIMTFSTDSSYDITAGSFLSGFRFTIDFRASNTAYNAYFDDHQGGISNASGYTTMVPEPISATLFIVGGATLGFRRYGKKRKTA